jgi:hypothetical protein
MRAGMGPIFRAVNFTNNGLNRDPKDLGRDGFPEHGSGAGFKGGGFNGSRWMTRHENAGSTDAAVLKLSKDLKSSKSRHMHIQQGKVVGGIQ